MILGGPTGEGIPIGKVIAGLLAGGSTALADSSNNVNDIDGITGADPGWVPCYEPTDVDNSVNDSGSEKKF